MKSRKLFFLISLMCLFAIALSAADLNGKWVAQMPGRDGGAQEMTFTFKVDGDTLTGTVASPRGEREISEGKVVGNDISFAISISTGGGDFKMLYKGKVTGNQINFTVQREGGERSFDFTARKI